MSKQANTNLIGRFVVGAVVLAISGILLFGSGKFFSHEKPFVLFFNESVKGLSIGSPVDFKGVKVGEVTEAQIQANPRGLFRVYPHLLVLSGRQCRYRANRPHPADTGFNLLFQSQAKCLN